MEFEKCKDILLRESAQVKKIGGLQDTIYNAVVSRDWTGFEGYFESLEEMGRELAAMESERERVFPELGGDSETFYAFARRLTDEQRREITDAYRSLKMETLRVRAAGETLMGYVASARATIAGFFEAAFPAKAAKTYSPYGAKVSGDMRSMVLNHRY